MAEKEIVAGKCRELQGVFQKAGSGSKTGLGETLHAWVAVGDRAVDALKIEAVGFGEHIKLVGDGEIHIAPAVREQLGQLCFKGGELDQIFIDDRKQLAHPS